MKFTVSLSGGFPITVAVSVTFVPGGTLVAERFNYVVVAVPTVSGIADELEEAKGETPA